MSGLFNRLFQEPARPAPLPNAPLSPRVRLVIEADPAIAAELRVFLSKVQSADTRAAEMHSHAVRWLSTLTSHIESLTRVAR